MTARTKVVISTVGPFLAYGEPLVGACVKQGTHYVDSTGESPFVLVRIAVVSKRMMWRWCLFVAGVSNPLFLCACRLGYHSEVPWGGSCQESCPCPSMRFWLCPFRTWHFLVRKKKCKSGFKLTITHSADLGYWFPRFFPLLGLWITSARNIMWLQSLPSSLSSNSVDQASLFFFHS